jgi:Uma2 family endonuclease
MATVTTKTRSNAYPTRDGRPMAETDLLRDLMFDLIARLKHRYAKDLRTYVSGNLLMFYVTGDKRKHVSPDVFVVHGVPNVTRDNYLIWEEGKCPDVIIELTSKSTRKEDTDNKFKLHRDVLKVQEYFLFDPRAEYLEPPLQGFRLDEGKYHAIGAVDQRLPSAVLGLHLERNGTKLELFDPGRGRWISAISTPDDDFADLVIRTRDIENRLNEEVKARLKAEADLLRLQRELDELRRRLDQEKK